MIPIVIENVGVVANDGAIMLVVVVVVGIVVVVRVGFSVAALGASLRLSQGRVGMGEQRDGIRIREDLAVRVLRWWLQEIIIGEQEERRIDWLGRRVPGVVEEVGVEDCMDTCFLFGESLSKSGRGREFDDARCDLRGEIVVVTDILLL